MRVLIVGGGGREHALAWGVSKSPKLKELYAAPGNPGIAELATCLDIAANDIEGLVKMASDLAIDLIIIGPEGPLALGLADSLAAANIAAFGPTAAAAQLETSKAWSKQFMVKYGIPTAEYKLFTEFTAALTYAQNHAYPLVIKASGLAAGKGAIIATSLAEAEAALHSMLVEQEFGAAGAQVVIEDYLVGPEVTLLALVAGRDFLVLPAAQDHKQVFDGDLGPNTGGMGAYSPVPDLTPALEQAVIENILQPTLKGLAAEDIYYQGVLYLGLILTEQGPQVIEYNARFGDPETQVVLPRLQDDVLDLLASCAQGRLAGRQLKVTPAACATVIMAAPGYPGHYQKGLPVHGLEAAAASGSLVFQAGTKQAEGRLVSSGGRILGVSALGESLAIALAAAYKGIAQIEIPGAHYRTDIGYRALQKK